MSVPPASSLSDPALRLSPLHEKRPLSPPPATPGVLYRSCFARECDDIVLQLSQGGCGPSRALPTPGRSASTVEAETLTPLESSWSFLAGSSEKPPPSPDPAPPSPANRTYVREPSFREASVQLPSEGLTFTRLQDTLEDLRRTFELVPIEASTPLKDFFPLPPRQPQQEATLPPRPSLCRAPHLPPSKGGPGRMSLAAVEAPVPISKAALAQGGLGKRSSIAGSSRASTARQESTGAPAAKGQMPDERTSLAKPPANKRSIRPPSRPSRGPGLLNPIVGRENKSPGSKLPVRAAAGGNTKKANQKRPLERQSVKGATTPQKQLAAKRSCPGKNHSEKPVLLNLGQIPSTTPLSRPAAPCSQCQQLIEENRKLTEENRRLKSMLEG